MHNKGPTIDSSMSLLVASSTSRRQVNDVESGRSRADSGDLQNLLIVLFRLLRNSLQLPEVTSRIRLGTISSPDKITSMEGGTDAKGKLQFMFVQKLSFYLGAVMLLILLPPDLLSSVNISM